jgi:Ca-activated chloride channel homolog
LHGRSGGANKDYFYNNLRFPLRGESNDFLPRLWATRRVGWLMEQVRTNGEQKELRDEIVDLGTRYGIVTPYTSYLALEPNAQPQEVTRISGAGNVGGGVRRPSPGSTPPSAPAMAAADAQATTGLAAVQQSKRARGQKEAERFDRDSLSSAVRTVGGKTFYLREGVWTDAEFKPEARLPETAMKFASDEYFALLKQKPRLADFFALGERVVVVFEGKVYRITAAGQ